MPSKKKSSRKKNTVMKAIIFDGTRNHVVLTLDSYKKFKKKFKGMFKDGTDKHGNWVISIIINKGTEYPEDLKKFISDHKDKT